MSSTNFSLNRPEPAPEIIDDDGTAAVGISWTVVAEAGRTMVAAVPPPRFFDGERERGLARFLAPPDAGAVVADVGLDRTAG